MEGATKTIGHAVVSPATGGQIYGVAADSVATTNGADSQP